MPAGEPEHDAAWRVRSGVRATPVGWQCRDLRSDDRRRTVDERDPRRLEPWVEHGLEYGRVARLHDHRRDPRVWILARQPVQVFRPAAAFFTGPASRRTPSSGTESTSVRR